MKESDIRPLDVFEEYLRLSAEDAERCFAGEVRERADCPACGSDSQRGEFSKHGFEYVSCRVCQTLYQSPRPPREAFGRFYDDSISSRFWAEKFFPAVAEARRERIFRPRVERIGALLADKGVRPTTVMDVGAGYGMFLEEWKERHPETRAIAIEPSSQLSEVCRGKGIKVVEKSAEDVEGYGNTASLVVCFEVLEHVHDPFSFVATLYDFVEPGGFLVLSTLGVDGFDIQVLWDKSNSVSPPHHINFLSIEGFHRLLERVGSKEVEVLTPGLLDVDIVRNAYDGDPELLEGNRFLQTLIRDEELAGAFQDFLIAQKRSSHVWVLARKTS